MNRKTMEGINDIFIQNTSGIPYIARCYGGNYCKTQPDHELVTGFFAAINSFRGELGQDELNNVIYDQINLVFESVGDLLVVCNIDNEIDDETFRVLAKKLRDEFMAKFGENEEVNVRSGDNFSEYISWMDEQVGQGMADLTPLIQTKPRGIFTKIKDWLV